MPPSRSVAAASIDPAIRTDIGVWPAGKSYGFVAALRPFSLIVALVSCGLGIRLATPEGGAQIALAFAVLAAGLLLQCGVNLINDRADLRFLGSGMPETDRARRQIERNFQAGLLSFAVASLIGVWIALQSGPVVIAVGLIGVLGACAYTQEPFNYKRRGLGVAFVFVLMGVLMVQGAYLAITGEFSFPVVVHSLPVSCLVSLLLLSNELRDYEQDAARGIRTLTVAIGFVNGVRLYWCLIVTAYLIAGLAIFNHQLAPSPWLLLPLPLLPIIKRHLQSSERAALTPITGRFLLLFGIGYAMALG